jgi:hypothetical protein
MSLYLVFSTAVVTGFSQTSIAETDSFDVVIFSPPCLSLLSSNRNVEGEFMYEQQFKYRDFLP